MSFQKIHHVFSQWWDSRLGCAGQAVLGTDRPITAESGGICLVLANNLSLLVTALAVLPTAPWVESSFSWNLLGGNAPKPEYVIWEITNNVMEKTFFYSKLLSLCFIK